MVAEPEAVRLEARRRVDQLDALALDAFLQAVDVLGVAAERQVVQRLGLAFDDRAPGVFMTEGLELQGIALAHHIQPEIGVEFVGHVHIGNGEDELIE